MPQLCTVCLLGFSDFERGALGSCLKLAWQRQPSYRQVAQVEQADLLLVDADDAQVLAAALRSGRLADAVFIGAEPPREAMAWMARPIDPLHLLRELDALVALRRPARAARGETTPPPTAAPPAAGRPAAALPPRNLGLLSPADPPPALPASVAARVATRVLLAEGGGDRLRSLPALLLRYGLSAARAQGSAAALALLGTRAWDFVFIDVDLGADSELDGLALCARIKREPPPIGTAPAVFMLAPEPGQTDRVRAMLAGADACLPSPPDDAALKPVLARHGLHG